MAGQTNQIAIFPDEDSLTPEKFRLVWPSTPGIRYEVRQSTNLQTWTTAPGFPATAEGPAQQMPFATDGNARFFQVRQLDEQPPAIVNPYPQDGGFAVPRFSNLTLQLSDVTGIDTSSVRLTVGNLGLFTLANTNLTWTNGVLTFVNGGSIPLGGWGSNVTATLIAADVLGNADTNTWKFTLETQPQVVTNLFVFGSPHAQRTGQRIGNIPTAVLAARSGPIPMDDGDPWTLELVETNRLVLSYTNIAPGFATNTYVCNLTPVRPEHIFNRKITGITDDPGSKRLTLFTVEVPLTEVATNGAASVSSGSVILQTGTNGVFVRAFEIGGTITFPRIGYSLDGAEFKLKDSVGDFDIVNLTLEEQHWWLTPRLQVALEVNRGELKRFEAIASGNIESASVWNVDFLLAGLALEKTFFDLPEALEPKKWMYLGSIGPVPVFASLGFDVKLKGRAEVHATVTFRAGKRETADAAFGLTYNQPDVQWVNTFTFPPPEVIPFTANINAEGSLKVSLEPALEFLVYGLAGVSAGITPSAGVVFEIGPGQPLSGRLEADVRLDLGLAGPAFELLNPTPEFSLPLWHDEWHLFPDNPAISFTAQPQSQTVQMGGSVYFSCTVVASETPSYQWYFNGVPMPGQNARTLLLPSVSSGHAGNYQVRVTAGHQTSNSAPAMLTVLPRSVETGLLAYYPFDGNADDASGNGHHGTVYGAPVGMDRFGHVSSCFEFAGTTSWIKSPLTTSFLNANYTISTWVRFDDFVAAYPVIVSVDGTLFQWHGAGSDSGYVNAGLFQHLGFWQGSPNAGLMFSQNALVPQQWYHVAIVRDGSNFRMYVSGLLSGEYTGGQVSTINGQFLKFGNDLEFQDGNHYLHGALDDIRIYNRALLAPEIQQLYNLSLPSPPSSMALIPAGSFQMGDSLDGDTSAQPVHTVTVSAFYMDKFEVTKALWDDVYQWAIGHGYNFDNIGSGKAANHPVQSINWYDMVKWCNARSEKRGLVPAYYTNAALTTVYRSGRVDVQNEWVKWNVGYRLPTEAEWEKAARGGVGGRRFPWPDADTITHSRANYYSYGTGNPSYMYDVNPTSGYHPAFHNGVAPSTSPVGYFAPNGYGLYDMSGNVWEWCWDWYTSYSDDGQADPRGATSGPGRVIRGGGWYDNAIICRASNRSSDGNRADQGSHLGFRSILPATPAVDYSAGLALIPAGSFQMGDGLDGDTSAQPVHTVYVSAFYMDRFEVTKALWDEVYNWATTHGYSFDNAGLGKAATHPVQMVSWYDCVKWCNARSEKENKAPAYYADVGLSVRYRTGQVSPYVNWSTGYRLPTEAEWEKAARGGASGHRFPWVDTDTITHSRANYNSSSVYVYDTSPTRSYHPTFNDGVFPYTSPAGYFAANGYGLYDMLGNVWEWCWDWYGAYSSSSQTDPHGPTTVSSRLGRGGSWDNDPFSCRLANRYGGGPTDRGNAFGFRSVLPPSQ